MTYCREVELPSSYRNTVNTKGLCPAEAWASVVDLLKEPHTAYAHLTRLASAIPSTPDTTADLAIAATTFRGKVISLLRQKIVEEDVVQNESVFRAIASMLQAETYGNNSIGASIHARMLAHMVQSGSIAVNDRRSL